MKEVNNSQGMAAFDNKTHHQGGKALSKMSGNLHGQAILASDWFLDEPGRAVVGIALEAVL